MKENSKKYVKLSIILYIVILSVALVGTLAWFVFEQTAEIKTSENGKITAGEYLEVAIDDKNDETPDEWLSKIELASPAQYPDISVTPDGKAWYPVELNDDDTVIIGQDGACIDVTDKDGYFVKLDLKVRASKSLNVYLHNGSEVQGLNPDKTDANNSFSKDAIAGAARVGFFDESGNVITVWVPNEKYELASDASSINYNGNAEESYKYLNVSDAGNVSGDSAWDSEKISVGNNALATDTMANEAVSLLSFDGAGEKKLTVYVWIEGTDREANTVLSGGNIKFNLKLVGIPKKAAAENSDIDIDAVVFNKDDGSLTYNGAEMGNEILYGFDADAVNTPYSQNDPNLDNLESGRKLYIRTAETKEYALGDIREITVP
ncbi:MAG: hypothetical protein IJD73_02865 [Clostridia bacterium]|nr:hypothetical protein [Clostridia bacterium]